MSSNSIKDFTISINEKKKKKKQDILKRCNYIIKNLFLLGLNVHIYIYYYNITEILNKLKILKRWEIENFIKK